MLGSKQSHIIAIDGPAGVGKSSVTRRLAETLGFTHIDTGALYRAIAYLVLQHPAPEDLLAIETARSAHLEFKREPNKNPSNRIYANGMDITSLIRTPEVSLAASSYSALPEVRAALVGLQRTLGCTRNSILEGRDIGTVIFPEADVKFFLTASLDERAKRRLIELEAVGVDTPSFEEVKHQIQIRDHGDSTRATAPLRRALDAIEIDTSFITLDEVVRMMEIRVRKKLNLG